MDVDDAAVRAALHKELAGEKLSGAELRLVKRYEKAQAERMRWSVYAALPKKDYVAMSGRHYKVIDEQGERYGLKALLEPVIDLRALLRQVHDLLAAKWHQFSKDVEAEALLMGSGSTSSPATERYRGYKADLEGLKVEEKRLDLLPRADVRTDMATLMSMIGTAADDLAREFGPEARVVIDEMVGRFEEHIRERYLLGNGE